MQRGTDVTEETLSWLRAACADPGRRLPAHLPKRLRFPEADAVLRNMAAAALPETEIGGILLLGPAGIEARVDLTWLAHYPPRVDGLPFLGTFHIHPAGLPPAFAPEDLAHILRSDNPGFLDLLLAAGKEIALVRTNPFVYIGAHRVDRDPLLLAGPHEEARRGLGPLEKSDPGYARHYRAATLSLCRRYQVAYYEGEAGGEMARTR